MLSRFRAFVETIYNMYMILIPCLATFLPRYWPISLVDTLKVGKIPGRYRELIKKNREDTELIKKTGRIFPSFR